MAAWTFHVRSPFVCNWRKKVILEDLCKLTNQISNTNCVTECFNQMFKNCQWFLYEKLYLCFLSSMLFGNLYVYFDWKGKTEISGNMMVWKSYLFMFTLLLMLISTYLITTKHNKSCLFTYSQMTIFQNKFFSPSHLYIFGFVSITFFFFFFTDKDRKIMFTALLVISALGTLSFLALRKVCQLEEALSEEEGQSLLSARLM